MENNTTDITDLFEQGIWLTREEIEAFDYPTVSGIGFLVVMHPNGMHYAYLYDTNSSLYEPKLTYCIGDKKRRGPDFQ